MEQRGERAGDGESGFPKWPPDPRGADAGGGLRNPADDASLKASHE